MAIYRCYLADYFCVCVLVVKISFLQFRPNLFLTLLAIIGMGFFISLGFWQLHRAEEKRQMLEMLDTRLAGKVLPLQSVIADQNTWQYQSVQFKGKLLNKQQFLLDNKINHGQVGYEVITPVRVVGIKNLVLLNRGWIAAGQDRRILPTIKSVFGSVKIHGIIRVPLAGGIVLKAENEPNNVWPLRIQQLDFQWMQSALHQPIYPFVVLLDKKAANGFVRDWQFVNSQPAKNIGYAVQWFVFAGVLFIIYFALTLRRREKKNNDSKS